MFSVLQEHHLQRAISAQQVYGEKRDNMVIPVPEAERNITHYESLYPGEFKMPKQLIHIQREYPLAGIILSAVCRLPACLTSPLRCRVGSAAGNV